MSLLPLRQEVFALLSDLIEERVGIHYEPANVELVADKISARAVEAGFDSLLDYYYYLRYDSSARAEFEALVENLVVGETYFFREIDQLRFIVDRLIEPAIQAGERPRVWSAACATGEEPLTLAMLLDEKGLLDGVHLIGSDVSKRALGQARSGMFRGRALRNALFARSYARWLREEEGRIRVDRRLIEAVDWRCINLTDAGAVRGVEPCDVILCKNVLIYFRDEVMRRVAMLLSEQLKPSGALFVGVSESLMRLGTSLVCEEAAGVFYYHRQKQP